MIKKRLSAFLLGTSIIAGMFSQNVSASEGNSLKDAYADFFLMGNILEPSELRNSGAVNLITNHFNIITAENTMKPVNMTRAKGQYNFEAADKLVEWALENNVLVHGHTLVWHSQSAKWLTTGDDGKPLTREEAKANLEEYINEVAGHYRGKVVSWDVVNEAFKTSVGTIPYNWMRELRSNEGGNEGSPWFMAYANGADEEKGESGGDYIYDAFIFARIADPDAVLYYNDYNETQNGKREAIAFMVEELNAQWKTDPRNTEPDRLLIEGIGMQAHYFTSDFSVDAVEQTIKRFARTGAEVAISELDIPIGSFSNYKSRTEEPNEEELTLQAEQYKQLFEVFTNHADKIVRVSLWGKADNQSWRKQGYPLIFARDYVAKPAYAEILNVAASAEPPVKSDETTAEEENEGSETQAVSDESIGSASGGMTYSVGILAIIGGIVVVGGIILAVVMINRKKG